MSSDDARTAKAPLDHNTQRAPHKRRVPAVDVHFFLHLDIRNPARPHLTHAVFTPTTTFSTQTKLHTFSTCLPKLHRRPLPPAARLRPERRPLRRRRLARRLPLPLVTRRSAPSPGRRLTPRTSTRVRICVCALHGSILTRRSPQAGPPRHWYLQPRHVHPELVRQRHFRARRHRGLQACCLQQEVHHLITRDPDLVRHLHVSIQSQSADRLAVSD